MPGNDITLKRRFEKTNPICRGRLEAGPWAVAESLLLKKRTQFIASRHSTGHRAMSREVSTDHDVRRERQLEKRTQCVVIRYAEAGYLDGVCVNLRNLRMKS